MRGKVSLRCQAKNDSRGLQCRREHPFPDDVPGAQGRKEGNGAEGEKGKWIARHRTSDQLRPAAERKAARSDGSVGLALATCRTHYGLFGAAAYAGKLHSRSLSLPFVRSLAVL
ncbi:hypothetical protein MTO96_003353 [Rhipicephalus appendiculatus]